MNISFKNILIIGASVIFPFLKGNAQLSEGGLPASFRYKEHFTTKRTDTYRTFTSPFTIEQLKAADLADQEEGAPVRIATLLPALLSPKNSGEWITLPGGELIWRLHIECKGARAIMLYYSSFSIPENGKLYLYNPSRTQVLGAFTHRTNPSTTYFATDFVEGDHIILEYESPMPSGDPEIPDIQIEEIGFGYHDMLTRKEEAVQVSGSCNVNINCEEGALWQTEKKGICKLQMRIGTGTYLCSGSLINNTANDLTPYILTATHCLNNGRKTATDEELAQWLFIFNYEKSDCSNTSPEKSTFSVTGCKNIAAIPLEEGSDGLLLLLTQPPLTEEIYYNGWDRRNAPANAGVCIHHPKGDVKKISTFTSGATHFTWQTSSETGARNAHWNATFSATPNGYGVTEGGSSGSPLFNENKLIVGTLTGGDSDCSYPAGHNVFGKLYYHWDQYNVASNRRMDIYLDPLRTGTTTLQGRYFSENILAPLHLIAVTSPRQADLQWEKPAYYETPLQYNIYRNNIKIGSTETCSYSDSPNEGQNIYYVTALYRGNRESTASLPVSVSGTKISFTDRDYQVYPNPVSRGEHFYIRKPDIENGPITVSVTDNAGKLILQQELKEKVTAIPMNNAGSYIIQIKNNRKQTYEFKIMVR